MHRRSLMIMLALVVSLLVGATSAHAVVVNDQGTTAGVALLPGTRADLAKAGVSPVTSSVSTCDPWLSSDLSLLPSIGLCSRGGPVMHANETFALTWDPVRSYWTGTRNYIEQFLKDVADGSGTGTSPFAITSQYRDAAGRAENASKYGGACIDYGNPGGYTCQFGDTTSTGVGSNYPASGCPATGADSVCVTDAQIQSEVTAHLQRTDLVNHLMPGYTPLLVVLIPPGVEVCVDSAGSLCSVGSTSKAQFCSYHSQDSQVTYNGNDVAYVVLPWTINTKCDEPRLPNPADPNPAIDAGIRLVNPLSQGEVAAIVNPNLNGWVANDGSEINDNGGCVPDGFPGDKVTVGNSAQNPYYIQPEFNNAGVIDTDPYVPPCALGVDLVPTFVVPSPIDQGDVVQFDGSVTNSTLIVPQANFAWNFGDGTTATGASKEHTYAKGGTYTVTLYVTDRGGYTASVSQKVNVLGANGQPVSSGTPGTQSSSGLHARMQLMPQSLGTVLRNGIAIVVSSNESAAGFATISIPRNSARRAHIATGRGPTVVIGRGTVSRISAGTSGLRLRLSRATAAKLARVGHTVLTIRLALVAAGGDHLAIVVAGRY